MLLVLLAMAGCHEPVEENATGEVSSSVSSDGSLPDRVPPEPFVLPEGCGDGVPVSGQYDCHYPVSLEYLMETMGTRQAPLRFLGWDMDGDGRDELLAQASGFDPFQRGLAPLRWNGESFDVGEVVGGDVDLLNWTTRFDLRYLPMFEALARAGFVAIAIDPEVSN